MNKEFTNYNIEELCVDPEYQRQGLGSEFMKMIEEEVQKGFQKEEKKTKPDRRGSKESWFGRVFLQTDSDKSAYGFYKKNKFYKLGKHVSMYKSVR